MKSVILALILSSFAFGFQTKEYGHEFAKGYIYVPKQMRSHALSYMDIDEAPVPDKVDLRLDPKGFMPIQDQGQCGSCYSFGTTAALESALRLHGKYPGKLSENYFKACGGWYGCGGGNFDVLAKAISPDGLPFEKTWPYHAYDERCKSYPVQGSAQEWHYVGDENSVPSTLAVQNALRKYGEIAVDVAVDGRWQSYSSGIFSGSYGSINHIVAIIGYDNEGAVADSRGEYPKGKGFFIVRNSWGTSWGENGFMRTRYHANSFADSAAFVVVKE